MEVTVEDLLEQIAAAAPVGATAAAVAELKRRAAHRATIGKDTDSHDELLEPKKPEMGVHGLAAVRRHVQRELDHAVRRRTRSAAERQVQERRQQLQHGREARVRALYDARHGRRQRTGERRPDPALAATDGDVSGLGLCAGVSERVYQAVRAKPTVKQLLAQKHAEDVRIREEKNHKEQLSKARNCLTERRRQDVRLRRRVTDKTTEAVGYLLRRQWREEQALDEVLQAAFRQRKEEEIEQRKLHKEAVAAEQEGRARHREARVHYMREQIQVLEEALAKARLDERIASQAHTTEERKRQRENKQRVEAQAQLVRDRLFAEETAERDRLRDTAQTLKSQLRPVPAARIRQAAAAMKATSAPPETSERHKVAPPKRTRKRIQCSL